MKYIIYYKSICYIAILTCLVIGQTKAQHAPFVGANTILLSTFLADQQAYEVITDVLASESLTFIPDGSRLLIRSQNRSSFTAKSLIFEGQITLNAGIVKLTGHVLESTTMESTALSKRSSLVLFTKGRNSPQRVAFNYMDALAKKLQVSLRGMITYKYQADVI